MIKCKNECPSGNFEGCCFECTIEGCTERCQYNPSDCSDSIVENTEETGLQGFQENQALVLNKIAVVIANKKKLEELEKELKEKLKTAMETHGIKKFTNNVLDITYIAATTETRVDSKKLKAEYPDIYSKCSKTGDKSAYIKINVT